MKYFSHSNKPTAKWLCAAAALAVAAPFALAHAQDKEGPFTSEIMARQGQMNINKLYMGVLGGMAKGNIPYDAKQAADAATMIHLTATMPASAMWPKGSDETNKELTVKTHAKPEGWSNYADLQQKHQAWIDASKALAEVAGNGLDEMKAALGPVGKSCKGCHDDFKSK